MMSVLVIDIDKSLVSAKNCLNPWFAETDLSRFNIVIIMVADTLAPCVTRASAAMKLAM